MVACDLDGTLLPATDLPALHELAAKHCLVYATGRSAALANQAITRAGLPVPQWLISDCGTAIQDAAGKLLVSYWRMIGATWYRYAVRQALIGVRGLRLQESTRQSLFKVSFYTAGASVLEVARKALHANGLDANLVYSHDGTTGLLDAIPYLAGKGMAVRFLKRHLCCHRAVFAGDSGNDLDVIGVGIPFVLVGNAATDVRARVQDYGSGEVYLAVGHHMAGVIEGLEYFA
jgi:HAD superfamily hydrolase (TIGR01484 family)